MPKEERERELKKKKWARPKLIVLTRGRSEEAVLVGCKDNGWAGEPIGSFLACLKGISGGPCAYCDAFLPS